MSDTEKNERIVKTVSGLRMRFFPKSRVGQGLIGIAPWLDLMALLLLIALLQGAFLLQPGVIVHLPSTTFSGGSRPALSLVALAVDDAEQGRIEIVFFDDARYPIANPLYRAALREAIVSQARRHPGGDLAILADRQLEHGTIMLLYDMAREAGIERVNLVARESDES